MKPTGVIMKQHLYSFIPYRTQKWLHKYTWISAFFSQMSVKVIMGRTKLSCFNSILHTYFMSIEFLLMDLLAW
jgi:hypothetical protein